MAYNMNSQNPSQWQALIDAINDSGGGESSPIVEALGVIATAIGNINTEASGIKLDIEGISADNVEDAIIEIAPISQLVTNTGTPIGKLLDGRLVYRAYVSLPFSDVGSDYSIKHINHNIPDIDTVLGYHFTISGYSLPYFSSGLAKTYIATVGKVSVDYVNADSWGAGYTLRGFIYYVK